MNMDKVVTAFEETGNLIAEVNFVPLAFALAIFWVITLPVWLPLYVLAKFISVLTH